MIGTSSKSCWPSTASVASSLERWDSVCVDHVAHDHLRLSLACFRGRYGTASPMSSMRPGDTLSCWEFNTVKPAANYTLSGWPEPITSKQLLKNAAALEDVLNQKNGTNAAMNRWVSLKMWRVWVDVNDKATGVSNSTHGWNNDAHGAVMCDLDRFSNKGAVIRHNVFQHGGHPQIGGRIKSSGV